MIRKFKNFGHMLVGISANTFFGFPSRKLKVIGVTGTDGKTTTASMIYHILKSSGKKVSLLSTVGAFMADGSILETGLHTTTPSSFYIQKYLRNMKLIGSDYVVLEVTSHALDQGRVFGIPFEIGVFTNISHEHLDYHKTLENYLKSKLKLLLKSKVCVISADDPSFSKVKSRLSHKKIVTFSLTNGDVTSKTVKFTLPQETVFNRRNALAATAVARELGVEDQVISKALKTFVLPEGRLEVVYNKGYQVIVDFAHTPQAFSAVLPEIRKKTKKRLIHIFGCAGQRDASKRPLMGKESSLYADVVILTAEDPRNEKVETINSQIKKGFEKDVEVYSIENRSDAIKKAVSIVKPGDTILITGKGHEKSINLGDGEIPWSDREAVLSVVDTLT